MPGWNTIITLGGTALSTFSEVDVEYKRATEIIPAVTGTQTPFAIFGGPVTVAGSITAIYQGYTADTNLQDYLTNTQPTLLVKVAPAGDAVNSILFQHSKVTYDVAAPSGTNKWMEVKATTKMLANATDALGGGFSPAQVILTSAQSTAY
ncbi:precorrin-2 methylase [Cryobacterium psychrotolerans]|nr:precorrin-2 methylase [Cryobacterium psychrotolerans]